ncbi:MAG: nucleoside triphosphate pyrophosphohydrolase [Acidobacteria bacterium]|nr:nucleoside triphosphate pyrophosphohydrolase [Acidobacteriota bacterium]
MPSHAAREFHRLVEIVAALRAPGGCPWDREQTLDTLRPFVLEEAYEVLHAIEIGDLQALRSEIGDFIFEGVLLAQVAAELGHFTVADSLADITDKLIRRHPHVFGGAEPAGTAGEVLGRWEEMKARERTGDQAQHTILSGIPRALPSLLRAYEMSSRASVVGFDWAAAADVVGKIEEEVAELRQAVEQDRLAGTGRAEEEMGDLLFALANLARKLGIEPEAALRRANDKFARRFDELERRFAARGVSLQQTDLQTMESEWGRIKNEEAEG